MPMEALCGILLFVDSGLGSVDFDVAYGVMMELGMSFNKNVHANSLL